MSQTRTPARAAYDAVIDLATNSEWGAYAFALIKVTYRITRRGVEQIAPEPLYHDMRDEEMVPRMAPGTDFWPVKRMTDVVVQGSAFSPSGVPTPQMKVSVAVGRDVKQVLVFGRRVLTWNERGQPRLTFPEPFEEVPLTWENAYGGVDFRVVDPELAREPAFVVTSRLSSDHPGLYPRNPFGKGYLVETDPLDRDVVLPQLEDPRDLLTPARLFTRDPRAWYKQPLPWCFEWVHPMTFPRYTHFVTGPDAWYPAPDDERLPEVRRGYLPRDYRLASARRPLEDGPHPLFFQGASHEMVFPQLPAHTPIRIAGMHPEEPVIAFELPKRPVVEMYVEAAREDMVPRLHSVVCRPAEKTVSLVYGATMPLQRPLIPGIHKHIPLAVSVNGDAPLLYEAPVPLREQLAEAMAGRSG